MKELNFEQMENIQAGVPMMEYCATIHMIFEHNPDQRDTEGMRYALSICYGAGY
ncbi:hypothetical protein [Marinifilum caeruleilacunae]|uniref:hypothetical protein n=1 Tax=Marinifilum caeruleilacunae TaxID=2499076 RepID=UPI001491C2EF|nr:hypothetical protein [Marinifilum caeruleilacunae]